MPTIDFTFTGKPGTASHDEHIRRYEAASQWVDDEYRTQHYYTTLSAPIQRALRVDNWIIEIVNWDWGVIESENRVTNEVIDLF
eukprot:SAG11_NODE_18453_length_490_cov_4.918159_1_plen_83_part_10